MGYYNYHAMIKKRILSGESFEYELKDEYHNIAPCLLIKFNDKIYPIREYRWDEYFEIFKQKSGLNK